MGRAVSRRPALPAAQARNLESGFRSSLNMACVSKEVPAFCCREIGNYASDPAHKAWDGVLRRLAQMSLHLAEGRLNRVEVGRVRRKIKQPRAHRFDRLLDAGHLVDWKIVHHHDIAALELGSKTLLHVSEKTSVRSWHPRARMVRPLRDRAGQPRK